MKKFDLKQIYNKNRPLSWSAISSFQWNKKQWHDKYVLGILPEVTPELEFGSMVDKRIQDDPTYLPHVIRYPVMQHAMRGTFDGIPLIGFADTYQPPMGMADIYVEKGKLKGKNFIRQEAALRDYKTGRKPWDQKRADETGQFTLYTFFLYLMQQIKPEDVELYIDWLPTHIEDGKIAFIESDHRLLKPTTFRTKRTMQQVLKFGQLIKDTWKEMEAYGQQELEKELMEW